jgi:broad specificity phosphatase PhoE
VIDALSELGKIQADHVAEHLSTFRVSYIYSSDIPRAVATSYVISDSMPDITIMLTKDLRLMSSGESVEDLKQRVKIFLDGLTKKFDNQTVIIVTHSDIIQLLFNLLGYTSKVIPSLASVSEFDLKKNTDPEAIRINDTKQVD